MGVLARFGLVPGGADAEIAGCAAAADVTDAHAVALVAGVVDQLVGRVAGHGGHAIRLPVGECLADEVVGVADRIERAVAGAGQLVRPGDLREVRRADDGSVVMAAGAALLFGVGGREPFAHRDGRGDNVVAQSGARTFLVEAGRAGLGVVLDHGDVAVLPGRIPLLAAMGDDERVGLADEDMKPAAGVALLVEPIGPVAGQDVGRVRGIEVGMSDGNVGGGRIVAVEGGDGNACLHVTLRGKLLEVVVGDGGRDGQGGEHDRQPDRCQPTSRWIAASIERVFRHGCPPALTQLEPSDVGLPPLRNRRLSGTIRFCKN